MPCQCLKVGPTLSPALPLNAKGSSSAADAPCGSCEDKNPPSGASRKSTNEPVASSLLAELFYGGFKLGRWANNKRRAALQ
jgi:hypothetical protein